MEGHLRHSAVTGVDLCPLQGREVHEMTPSPTPIGELEGGSLLAQAEELFGHCGPHNTLGSVTPLHRCGYALLKLLRASREGRLEAVARRIVGDGSIIICCNHDISKAHVPMYLMRELLDALPPPYTPSKPSDETCGTCGGTGETPDDGDHVAHPCPLCTPKESQP